MFAAFLTAATSISIKYGDVANALELAKTGPTFMFACSSDEFEYSTISRAFVRSAHLSTVEANYIVIDTSKTPNAKELLGVKDFPCLVYAKNGKVLRTQYRGFDEDFIVAFINTNFIDPIETIKTKEHLEEFYKTTACGIIVAKADASDEKYPHIADFYREYSFEVSVVYVDPAVFGKEGFFLYRYIDSVVLELTDLSNLETSEIISEVNKNTFPEFPKVSSQILNAWESQKQMYVILLLSMDDFYLTQDQLDLIHQIKEHAGVNVTYSDIENSAVVGMTYGLVDVLDSSMAIIDARGDRTFKYMLGKELTAENALELINKVNDGTATKFWKSELEPSIVKGEVQQFSANTLIQAVEDKKDLLLAIYFSNKEPIQPYMEATQDLVKKETGFVYGRFSVALNDWPLKNLGDELPFLVGFKGGKVTYAQKLGETAEVVKKQIEEYKAADKEL